MENQDEITLERTSEEEIGEIISDESTPSFDTFKFNPYHDKYLSPGTIISVKVNTDSFLLGRISKCYENNPHQSAEHVSLKHTMNLEPDYPEESESISIFRTYEVDIVDQAKLVDGKYSIFPPHDMPRSGQKVFIPPSKLISETLGLLEDEKEGLKIGLLSSTADLEKKTDIILNKKIIQRHVFICGTTGSGKSYAAKVLAEELNKHNLPIIFLDTQNEFTPLVKQKSGTVLKPGENYFVKLSSLSEDELLNLIPTLQTEHQKSLLSSAFLRLKNPDPQKETQSALFGEESDPKNFDVADLIKSIDGIYKELSISESTYKTVRQRTQGYLNKYKFLGNDFNWKENLKEGSLISIDCSKYSRQSLQLILAASLRELQYLRRKGEILPYAFFIDEAHLFVPQSEDSPCEQVIREGVRIGRHHGICMVLITQSPIDIDKKVIRQCNTRLLFAIEPDQLEALQGVKSDATPEMIRMMPKSPVGTCIVSGTYETIKHAVPTRIREMETKDADGGKTPDIFSEVKKNGK